MLIAEHPFYLVTIVFHLCGILLSFPALLYTRTPQGTFGWVMSLCFFPYLAIPLYLILGPRKFEGYIRSRRKRKNSTGSFKGTTNNILKRLEKYHIEPDTIRPDLFEPLKKLVEFAPLNSNSSEILIDAEHAYRRMYETVINAQNYILVQFYIIKNDQVGEKFKDLLIERAKAGISVYVILDEIGSHKLKRGYISELRKAGVHVEPFNGKRFFLSNIIRVNFRNHRKAVIADGKVCDIGGLNVGMEYIGKGNMGYWRDTMVEIKGPAVLQAQLAYLEDWNWSTGREIPELCWDIEEHEANKNVLVIPSGPADQVPTWRAAVIAMANSARQRLWLATPYFVPDSAVLAALQAAALRGIDIRILIPEKTDNLLVKLSSLTFLPETIPYGIKMLSYTKGFLHQKVMLVDDDTSCIGTANLDNRSLSLNFEMSVFIHDAEMADTTEKMLLADMKKARVMKTDEYLAKPLLFRVGCNIARLMAPVL